MSGLTLLMWKLVCEIFYDEDGEKYFRKFTSCPVDMIGTLKDKIHKNDKVLKKITRP